MTAIALVTGASRGVGRGVATALCDAGLEVFATGRSVEGADLPRSVRRVRCDHRKVRKGAAPCSHSSS